MTPPPTASSLFFETPLLHNGQSPESPFAETSKGKPNKKPDWLKVSLRFSSTIDQLKAKAKQLGLATVCQEARCPNLHECWSEGTATFMLMGDVCTRGCRFCNVKTGQPNGWLDPQEPEKLARTITEMGWHYVVLTSVDRDDLADGGASHFAQCVKQAKQKSPHLLVETLIPDFKGCQQALVTLLASNPEVVAHNLETVERLTPMVRDRRAGYAQSLAVLKSVKALATHPVLTKTSVMLGLGETPAEVRQLMADARAVGVDVITFGQYLQPSPKHLPVVEYVEPAVFEQWHQEAVEQFGFLYCASGPLVRSSYRAGEYFLTHYLTQQQQQGT
jgi:lipoyl synthase